MPTLFIWLIWLAGLYAWGCEIGNQVSNGSYTELIIFLLLPPFLFLIYLSEGIEIAVADLNDKDAQQFADKSLQDLLSRIKSRLPFFVANQQALALCIVTLLTTVVSVGFREFWVFPIGTIKNSFFVGVINFVFLSILILCLCQVPSKKLALRNSERFLAQAKMLWPLIRLVGMLNLSGPSEFIERHLIKLVRFPERRLLPNRSSHYNASARIHGYCVDQLATQIQLRADGSADLVRCYLAIFIHGDRKVVTGRMRAGLDNSRVVDEVELIAAWKLPACEDLRDHNIVLDESFLAAYEGKPVDDVLDRHSVCRLALQNNMSIKLSSGRVEDPDWTLNFLDGLPEAYCRDDKDLNENVVCLLYRAHGSAKPGSFVTADESYDYWTERLTAACRRFRFAVKSGDSTFNVSIQSCEVGLEHTAAALMEEARNCDSTLKKLGFINFPIQAAVYKINWQTMFTSAYRRSHEVAGPDRPAGESPAASASALDAAVSLQAAATANLKPPAA